MLSFTRCSVNIMDIVSTKWSFYVVIYALTKLYILLVIIAIASFRRNILWVLSWRQIVSYSRNFWYGAKTSWDAKYRSLSSEANFYWQIQASKDQFRWIAGDSCHLLDTGNNQWTFSGLRSKQWRTAIIGINAIFK